MKKLIVLCSLSLVMVGGFVFAKKKTPTPYKIALPSYVARNFESMHFPNADNPMTVEGVELGRHLFYDKNLSKGKNISCASCHIQAFAFTDSARFSVGFENQIGDRNSMPLANLGWSSAFFWDGRSATLIDQIHEPLIDKREMASTWADALAYVKSSAYYTQAFRDAFPKTKISDVLIKKALEQFILSITSFNTRYDQYFYQDKTDALTAQEIRGFKLFTGKAQCTNCHNTVLVANNQFMNNGLDSMPNMGYYNATALERDWGLMKTPTLRNVGLTAPYMHDGRFETLEEVVHFYNNNVNKLSKNLDFRLGKFTRKGGLGLNQEEVTDLISFLHALTDSTLVTNPQYSDPWK